MQIFGHTGFPYPKYRISAKIDTHTNPNNMRKFLLSIIIGLILFPQLVSAAVNFEISSLRAVIEADNIVEVEKNILFDGSKSFLPDKNIEAVYEWDFGDGSAKEKGSETVHSYSKSGQYNVKLTVTQNKESSSVSRDVFVYKKLIVLLTDVTERKASIELLTQKALEEGTYINVIDSYDSTTAFMSEETLSKKLSEQVSVLLRSDVITAWTTRGSGITALTRLVRERPEMQEYLKDKTIVVISDKNLNTVGRIMQSNFDIIQPKQIVLTREYKLEELVKAKDTDTFISDLKTGVSEYKIINAETRKVGIWNFMSYLVNFMIAQGIPSNTIVLLLMLPVIATIITFLKQVVGVTTFGLYTPAIITLSFLALGLKFGLIIFFIILITGAILRQALEHVRLLNTPRVALVFTFSAFIILMMLGFATYLGISELATIAVFPMLIMTTLAEKFISAQSDKGVYAAILLMIETTVVSLICYWIVEWQFLQNLMLSYPEIILLLILVNLILGKWTGLRIFEYIRFREVMKHTEE